MQESDHVPDGRRDAVSEEVREAIHDLVCAGLDDKDMIFAIVVAAANLIGQTAGSLEAIDHNLAQMRDVAVRVHARASGGGTA